MIDLHCHILPGIDDGAGDLEEAIAICRLAAADGCKAMIATPHQRRGLWWNCDAARLDRLHRELQQGVGPGLRLLLGGEIHVDSPRVLDELERLTESGLQPLAGSRYLLLEFNPAFPPAEAGELVHELVVAGWFPVLAHPEFIPWMADPDALARLLELGALAQVTAMSLTGDFGRRPQSVTRRLLKAGQVHFVASDAHGTTRRPPGLRRAYSALAKEWGSGLARRLLIDNPQAVIENRPLPQEASA